MGIAWTGDELGHHPPPLPHLTRSCDGGLVAAEGCWWCVDCGSFGPVGHDDRCTDAVGCLRRRQGRGRDESGGDA